MANKNNASTTFTYRELRALVTMCEKATTTKELSIVVRTDGFREAYSKTLRMLHRVEKASVDAELESLARPASVLTPVAANTPVKEIVVTPPPAKPKKAAVPW